MPPQERLTELAEARRLLQAEADLHRQLIRMELADLRRYAVATQTATGFFQTNRPVKVAGAVMSGLLAARHWRSVLRWSPLLLSAWRWWRAAR